MKTAAYLNGSIELAEISFFAASVAALVISCAFFWGFYMLMSGNVPARRLKVFAPHAQMGF